MFPSKESNTSRSKTPMYSGSSDSLSFLARRTGAGVDRLLCGTPVLSYANTQVGILYGLLIGGGIYLRDGLHGRLVDCSQEFYKRKKAIGNIAQLSIDTMLAAWMQEYWQDNKAVIINESNVDLAIMAPLTVVSSVDGGPIETLTVHKELHGDVLSVATCFFDILFGMKFKRTGAVDRLSDIAPTVTLPLLPVPLGLFHDQVQRARILASLCSHVGMPLTDASIKMLSSKLASCSHRHISVQPGIWLEQLHTT